MVMIVNNSCAYVIWLVPGIVQWVQQSWQLSHVGNLTRQNHPDIPTTLIYLSCNWDSFDWGDFFIGAVAWEDSGIWKQRPKKHPENEFGCKAARKMEKKNPLSPLQEKTLLHSHPSSYPGYDSSFAHFFLGFEKQFNFFIQKISTIKEHLKTTQIHG